MLMSVLWRCRFGLALPVLINFAGAMPASMSSDASSSLDIAGAHHASESHHASEYCTSECFEPSLDAGDPSSVARRWQPRCGARRKSVLLDGWIAPPPYATPPRTVSSELLLGLASAGVVAGLVVAIRRG